MTDAKKQIDWDEGEHVDHLTQTVTKWVTVDGRRKKFVFSQEIIDDKGLHRCITQSNFRIEDAPNLPDVVNVKNGVPQRITFG